MDCIFCKIANGDIKSAKLYEDENIISFLDIAPSNKGHALVLPKKHFETLLDLPDEMSRSMISTAKRIAKALSAVTGSEGFNVLVNNKRVAGQVVPHVHMHVIPRFKDDSICLNWKPRNYKTNEIEELAGKIVKFL